MKNIIVLSFLIAIMTITLNAKTTVNKSIHVAEGERLSGGCTTVNGSIVVDEGAEVLGGCTTVNGSITVARNCIVRYLKSVNGTIRVQEETQVESDIESVNGAIQCEQGVRINGDIETVNGAIKLRGTEVEDDVTTYNGAISLSHGSIVHHDIIIKDSKGHNNRREPLRITIDDSIVEGDIINREDDIEVIVTLRNGGKVKGDIIDAQVEKE